MKNERIIEFEDGQHSIIDLDLLYGEEPKTNIPGFDRAQKEIFKQILVDLIDISLNEYSMHYICHTDVQLGKPFESMRDQISAQFKSFYNYSVESMPFALWNEVISEHYQILMNILPLWLQKELVDFRTKFARAYTRRRVERNLKEFQKNRKNLSPNEERKVQVFSTQATENDCTTITEDEYTEIIVSDVLNTPFYSFINEQLAGNKSKNLVLSFLAYMKDHEPEVIRAFNDCFHINKDFYKITNLKNRSIENYKKPRGFPLKLGENEHYLFSFDYDVTYERLLKMKNDREKEKEVCKPPVKRKDYSYSEDSFFDSCDDVDSVENFENLKPIKKKATLKPLSDGKCRI